MELKSPRFVRIRSVTLIRMSYFVLHSHLCGTVQYWQRDYYREAILKRQDEAG